MKSEIQQIRLGFPRVYTPIEFITLDDAQSFCGGTASPSVLRLSPPFCQSFRCRNRALFLYTRPFIPAKLQKAGPKPSEMGIKRYQTDTSPLFAGSEWFLYIGFVMRHCAGSILTDAVGRALILWQPRQKYGLPGGIVEPDETPSQAAVREAKEEIGVAIELEYLIGMYHVHGGGKLAIVSTIFKARVISGVPHIADPNEVLRLEWLAPGTVPTPIVNDVRAALPDFWAGRRGVVRTVERL